MRASSHGSIIQLKLKCFQVQFKTSLDHHFSSSTLPLTVDNDGVHARRSKCY